LHLENTLGDVFTDNAIEKRDLQRVDSDRCELASTVKSTEKFVESLPEKCLILQRSLQHRKLCSCAIYIQVNLWFCVTLMKVFFRFAG
jgi:hypothetical protein